MSEEKTIIELSKEEKAVITALEKLNVVSLNNVVKFMEEEYGISASAPVAMAAAPAAGGGEAAAEKDSFNVMLTEIGGNKIAVIKAVKEITGLGLKESKDIVDAAPKAVKEGVKKEEGEEIKAKLIEAGAVAELA